MAFLPQRVILLNNFDGILLVNKPTGLSSHDVVKRIRKKLDIKAVGHAGTLDPFATGLLILLLGKATKISNYLLNQDKEYIGQVCLGILTDTWDRDGKILCEKTVDMGQEEIKSAVSSLRGELDLQVPIYSAIKKQGKKLYEYAREEKEVVVPSKRMLFKNISDLEFLSTSELRVKLNCSKGSYIRSWAMKLGEDLGCGAHLKELVRTKSGSYELEAALDLDEVLEMEKGAIGVSSSYIPIEKTLESWPSIRVDGKDEKLMRNGQISHSLSSRLSFLYKKFKMSSKSNKLEGFSGVKIYSGERSALVALLVTEGPNKFSIGNVFPT